MIGYTTIGTNDLEKSCAYYDALFATVGAGRAMEMETFVAWGKSPEQPMFSVIKPFDGNPATTGNGVMIALTMESTEQVGEFHAKALELGGTTEGEPGARGDNFYAAYFRDLDGNKVCAFTITA